MTLPPLAGTIGGMTIHERIKSRRESLGLTLEQVGERLGVSWQAVQAWETRTAPKRTRVADVARVLETTAEHLLLGADVAGACDYSPRALEIAALYDALPPAKRRLLYAQAQVLHNPDVDFSLGDEEQPAVEPTALPVQHR
jgi:transcriptional regulator with XRE-family HTH domain